MHTWDQSDFSANKKAKHSSDTFEGYSSKGMYVLTYKAKACDSHNPVKVFVREFLGAALFLCVLFLYELSRGFLIRNIALVRVSYGYQIRYAHSRGFGAPRLICVSPL